MAYSSKPTFANETVYCKILAKRDLKTEAVLYRILTQFKGDDDFTIGQLFVNHKNSIQRSLALQSSYRLTRCMLNTNQSYTATVFTRVFDAEPIVSDAEYEFFNAPKVSVAEALTTPKRRVSVEGTVIGVHTTRNQKWTRQDVTIEDGAVTTTLKLWNPREEVQERHKSMKLEVFCLEARDFQGKLELSSTDETHFTADESRKTITVKILGHNLAAVPQSLLVNLNEKQTELIFASDIWVEEDEVHHGDTKTMDIIGCEIVSFEAK